MWLRGPSPIANSLESRLHFVWRFGYDNGVGEGCPHKRRLARNSTRPPPRLLSNPVFCVLTQRPTGQARDESYPQYPVIFTHHTSQALELAKLPSSKALSGHSKTLSTCEYAYTSNVLICMCICLYRLYSYTLRYERLHRHYTRHTYIHACIPTYHYLPTYVHTYVYICIHTHRYYRCGL